METELKAEEVIADDGVDWGKKGKTAQGL